MVVYPMPHFYSQGSRLTRPDPLREMAVSVIDEHWGICEGRDDLERLFAEALRTAHRQGQESMRERAANAVTCSENGRTLDYYASRIHALSLDEPETEGGV